MAELEPAQLAGTTVSRATLHNVGMVEQLDVRVGDTVIIQKAGEVIPQVMGVDLEARKGHPRKFKMPEACPVCGTAGVRDLTTTSLQQLFLMNSPFIHGLAACLFG